jgi:hypothetical protein
MEGRVRLLKGGVAHVSRAIEEDLDSRETTLQKPHKAALADLCACALASRNANTGEWISILPRDSVPKSRERYMSRFLSNSLIRPIDVMKGFVPEFMSLWAADSRIAVLMMDQSKIANDFECLMISLRLGERAVPVAWRVVKTKGNIGFSAQEALLNEVLALIPVGVSVLLSADRFYGTSALVGWCQQHGWGYRIRLKGNLIFEHQGGEITPQEALVGQMTALEGAQFHQTNIKTSIGILHEKGHKEPWFIAMECTPSQYKTLDYGMRWGIESLFSDFKSRGFSITKTHLQDEMRIERLILVLSIALIWAVSTGMQPQLRQTKHTKKKLTAP